MLSSPLHTPWTNPHRDLRLSRFAFYALCCYLASQVIYVPVLRIGPSWAVWPTPSDFAVALLAASIPLGYLRVRRVSRGANRVFRYMLIMLAGMVLSYLVISLQSAYGLGKSQGQARFGLFQTFQFAKFVFVFWAAAGLPLSKSRIKTLSSLVGAVFVLVFLGVVATYTSALPTSTLVSHLSSDPGVSGPWASLYRYQPDVGTMGYNHAYVAIQLIMLLSLRMSLRPIRSPLISAAYLATAGAGVFMSGSRAGLVAVALLMAVYFIRRPAITVFVAVLGVIAVMVGPSLVDTSELDIGATIERYTALRAPTENKSLSGRPEIWQSAHALIKENPSRLVIGAGPGMAVLTGDNAHMLYLQILVEGGLIGLAVFLYTAYRVIRFLIRHEDGMKPVLLATLVLLVTSLTQETFYPVPAMGHFLGLYLCALGLVFARTRTAPSPQGQVVAASVPPGILRRGGVLTGDA